MRLAVLWRKHAETRRYLLAGAWNTLFGYLLFSGFYWWLSRYGLNYQLIFCISSIPAILCAFLVYKFLVFASDGNPWREFSRFVLVNLAASAVNFVLLTMLVEYVLLPILLGQALATVGIVIGSYLLHRKFTFGVKGVSAPSFGQSRVRQRVLIRVGVFVALSLGIGFLLIQDSAAVSGLWIQAYQALMVSKLSVWLIGLSGALHDLL